MIGLIYFITELVGKRWPEASRKDVLQWAGKNLFQLKIKTAFRLKNGRGGDDYAALFPSDAHWFEKYDKVKISRFLDSKRYELIPTVIRGRCLEQAVSSYITGRASVTRHEEQEIEIIVDFSELVVLADEVKRMEKKYPELLDPAISSSKKSMSPVVGRSDLHIIGGLVELLLESTQKHLEEKPPYRSNAKLIEVLLERNEGLKGMSKKTLETRFSDAKKAINAVE